VAHSPAVRPTRSDLTFWGRAATGDELTWEWAQQRLEEAADYWLVTVDAAGRPVTRPVWGIWRGDRLLLSVGSTSHWRNLRARQDVTVSLGDAAEVVVVEGRASVEEDDATLDAYVEAYNQKYAWSFTRETAGGAVAVDPTAVLAWISGPPDVNAQDTFPLASSRWRF
jgi:hypothetical protein